MSRLIVSSFGISIDGYSAGPHQSLANPLGVGGPALMQWAFTTRTFQAMHGGGGGDAGVDDDFAARGFANTGAWINTNVHVGSWHPNLDVPLYASGIYGLIILIVMLFRPEGLIPSKRVAAEMHEGVHDEPLYDSQHAGAEA